MILGAASGTRTRTTITGQGILSPSCLPFHHRGKGSIVTFVLLLRRKGTFISRNLQRFLHNLRFKTIRYGEPHPVKLTFVEL